MESKTPQFDAALDAILANLTPHTRTCAWQGKTPYCYGEFEVESDDVEFYHKLRTPPPTLCPNCRRQRRLSFSNYTTLFKRDNHAPEGPEQVISWIPPIKSWTVYAVDYYISDKWDRMSFGRAYDSGRSWLEQLMDLRAVMPNAALVRDPSNINCDFTVNGRNLKNAYWVAGGWNSEDIYYSIWTQKCRNCVDCFSLFNNTDGYENTLCEDLYHCQFCIQTRHCVDCTFMFDCRNCNDCFGCVNLRNRKFYWFNEQLTEEEYRAKRAAINLGSRSELQRYQEQFWQLIKSLPVLATRIEKSTDCIGTQIESSDNCRYVYFAKFCQNMKYTENNIGCKDCMDMSMGGGCELVYDCCHVGSDSARTKFSFLSKFMVDCEYCITCRHCQNCFGCVGIENKKYCILNRQYEPDEYWQIVDHIKTKMLEQGTYGELFPLEFSSFAYNKSIAQVVFPMDQTAVEQIGGMWQPEEDLDLSSMDTIPSDQIPDDIADVQDGITNKALICSQTGRPFRIVPYELQFYRTQKLPLPDLHPNVRILNRLKHINNFRLVNDHDAITSEEIWSMYPSDEGWRPVSAEKFKNHLQ